MAFKITANGSALEFDTTISSYNSVKKITSNKFIVAYGGTSGDGFVQLLEMNTSTGAMTEVGSGLEFDTGNGQEMDVAIVDSTHFLIAWQGVDSDGFIRAFSVDTSTGTITALGSAVEFDTTLSGHHKFFQVDSTHFLLVHEGAGSDGFADIFTVNTSTWAVTETSSLEFDTGNCQHVSVGQLDSTHFIVTYAGGAIDGFAQVLAVNTGTWAVTNVGTPLEFDTADVSYNSVVVLDSTHFINFWATAAGDGEAQVFVVDGSWNVTAAGSVLEFEGNGGTYNAAIQVASYYVMNLWQGVDGDGFAQVFKVNTGDWSITTSGSALEFDTSSASLMSVAAYDSTRYVVAYTGVDGDGFTISLTVTATPDTVLNTADNTETTDTTPTLDFTATDPLASPVEYNVQIDTVSTFNSQAGIGHIIDSYSEANQNTVSNLANGFNTAHGQSITGDGSGLSAIKFYIRKSGSPTGNAVAKVYAHSGVFGTSSVPTGAALATSDNFDVSTLTTSLALVTFNFSGANKIELVKGTNYVITLEYSGGDGSNLIQQGIDTTSPTHGGNFSDNNPSWEATATWELCFYVHGGVPLLNEFSETDSGFVNPDNGGDTHPFNSGENIQFTVQGGDALSRGTNHWRVWAKAPAGSDIYGDWSTTRRLHIFEADREVSYGAVATVPTNANHPWSDIALAFTDTQYTNIDSDNATRVSLAGGVATKAYFLQKQDIGSAAGFTVSFDGQVDTEAVSGTPSLIASASDTDGFSRPPPDDQEYSFSFDSGSTGTNRIMLVALMMDANVTLANGTYAGNALTHRKTISAGSGLRIMLYYLLAPPTGSNTMFLELSAAALSVISIHVYDNVNQSTPFDVADEVSANGTVSASSSFSANITTNTNNAMIVGFASTDDAGNINLAVPGGQTQVTDISDLSMGGVSSYETKATAGTESHGYNNDDTIFSGDYLMMITALKPSTITPSIRLDLWNFDTTAWVNQDEETTPTANTDFALSADKTTGYEDFVDGNGWVYARVYANYGPSVTLRVDQFVVELAVTETEVSSERSAKITGKATSNAERAATLKGKATANAERSVTLKGTATTNSERSAKIHGTDDTSSERNAKVTGQATSSSERDSKLLGQAQANAERASKIHGTDEASAERAAKVTGQATANSERSATLEGTLPAADSERDAKVQGTAQATSERDGKITGTVSTNNERSAKLTGVATATSERAAKTTGQQTASSERNSKLVGTAQATSERSARLTGKLVDERAAKITGQAQASAERDAKLIGILGSDSERSAKTTGQADSSSERSAKIIGKQSDSSERDAKVTGQQTANNERAAKTTGKAIATSERAAKLTGQIVDERNAKITGLETDESERDAKLTGNQPTSSERFAKLTGTATASSERSAKTTGNETDDSERAAKLIGVTTASSERAAKIVGTDEDDSERNARLTGLGGTSSERSAKLTGTLTTSSERSAKIIGGVVDEASVKIYAGFQFTVNDDFSTTDNKDEANTTAKWEGDGEVTLQ